jgi:hypothetical protein
MNEAWSRSDNPAAALVAFFGMMSPRQREALRDALRIVQAPESPAPGENAEASGNPAEPEQLQPPEKAEIPEKPHNPENPGNPENPENRENREEAPER